MSKRKRWLLWVGGGVVVVLAGLFGAGVYLAGRVEPFLREQTVAYLQEKFQADVALDSLKVRVPIDSPLDMLLRGGEGATVEVTAGRTMVRPDPEQPPMVAMRGFSFVADVKAALDKRAVVRSVRLDGLELNLPPRTAGAGKRWSGGLKFPVHVTEIVADGTKLTILPKDPAKDPLVFEIHKLRLDDAGADRPMKYTAELTNAKPPGLIQSTGTFGPWNSAAPAATPVEGQYYFRDADLGVFRGIAGKLASTGTFFGPLNRLAVEGETRTPDFQLKLSGNAIPLTTKFTAVVDGTNGNTVLSHVEARLGETVFDVKGDVVRYKGAKGRTVDLSARFRQGRLEDVLRLAVKGDRPIMRGGLGLTAKILVPPGPGAVADKLRLEGDFQLSEALFTDPVAQEGLDGMGRRAVGQPNNAELKNIPSDIQGTFRMGQGVIEFSKLDFQMPGAVVDLTGRFVFATQVLDFHGTLKTEARVSQMMKARWKRLVLKPVDPFFAKQGYGMVAKIKIGGTRDRPEFGLDRGDKAR